MGALVLSTVLTRGAEAVAPREIALMLQITGFWRTSLLHVAAKLRIADLLGDEGKTAAELAHATGAHEDALHRALRALASAGIFTLDAEGRFRNNRLSSALRSDAVPSLRDAAEYFGSPASLEAWADIERTVMTGEPAFARVHGVSMWEWLAAHPDDARAFAGTMTCLTEMDAPAVAAAYPFERHARVCDLAGGRGTLLAEILVRNPKLGGVLFDAPHVLELATDYLAARGVEERVERVAGDFFADPAPPADAYLLRDVLHDWDDARATKILKNVRRSIAPGGRVLVVEVLVDRHTTMPPGPLIDAQMLVVCDGGRQRSADEYAALFRASGFRLVRVHTTSLSVHVVEAEPV